MHFRSLRKTGAILAALCLLSGTGLAAPVMDNGAVRQGVTGVVRQQRVSSMEQLVDAIGNNMDIVLAPGRYDITAYLARHDVTDTKWRTWHPNITWDGQGMKLINLTGLRISAPSGRVEIVTHDKDAAVLNFEKCSHIDLEGLKMGHVVPSGGCSSSVLTFYDCRDVDLEHMDLYGCGAYGIDASQVRGLEVEDSVIHDCTHGGVMLYGSDAKFEDCVVERCDGTKGVVLYSYNSRVHFEKCLFRNNPGTFFNAEEGNGIVVEDCKFGRTERDFLDKHIRYIDYMENGGHG